MEAQLTKESLTLPYAEIDLELVLQIGGESLAIPYAHRETDVVRRPPKGGLHEAHLCLGEPPGAPRAIALGKTGKALLVKTTDPVLHRARGISEPAEDVGRGHPLGHKR